MSILKLNQKAAKPDYLNSLSIAAPCNVNWDSMQGDERVRHCGQCNKNVYNLSEMTAAEANEFLQLTALKACVNFHKRSDGTIITDNCPVGLRRLRAQYRRVAAAVTTMVSLAQGLFLSAPASDSAKSESAKPAQSAPTRLGGEPTVAPTPLGGMPVPPLPVNRNVPRATRGEIEAIPEPTAITSYRKNVESLVAGVMPKNSEVGKAAISLEIGTNGSVKSVQLVNKSPKKEVDDQILASVRKLKFEKLPAEYHQSGTPDGSVRMYFECRRAANP